MRNPYARTVLSLVPFSRAFPALLCLGFSLPGFADEVRVYHPDDKSNVAGNLTILSRPRITLRLVADVFSEPETEPDSSPVTAPVAQKREASEFTWTVSCTASQKEEGCSQGGFTTTREGVSFVVPDFLKEDETLEIIVTHESGEHTFLRIKYPAAVIELDPKQPRKGSGPGIKSSEARPPEEQKVKSKNKDDDTKPKGEKESGMRYAGGGGGGSSAGSSSSSSGGKRSRGKKDSYDRKSEEKAFGDFFSSYGGGGGGGSGGTGRSAPGTRGYNRNDSTPVISCSQQPKAGGGFALVCEKPGEKVLRVRRAPAPGLQARKKQWLQTQKKSVSVKKAAPKKPALPAPANLHPAKAAPAVKSPRSPAKAVNTAAR